MASSEICGCQIWKLTIVTVLAASLGASVDCGCTDPYSRFYESSSLDKGSLVPVCTHAFESSIVLRLSSVVSVDTGGDHAWPMERLYGVM